MWLSQQQRKSLIISTGVRIANEYGLTHATPIRISEVCTKKTSAPTVRKYFKRRGDLWLAIAEHKDASERIKREAVDLGII